MRVFTLSLLGLFLISTLTFAESSALSDEAFIKKLNSVVKYEEELIKVTDKLGIKNTKELRKLGDDVNKKYSSQKVCSSLLKEYGLSFIMFAMDNKEKLPDNLEMLLPEAYAQKKLACSNVTSAHKHFFYVGKGITRSKDSKIKASQPVIIEHPLNHKKKKILVSYMDGHVASIPLNKGEAFPLQYAAYNKILRAALKDKVVRKKQKKPVTEKEKLFYSYGKNSYKSEKAMRAIKTEISRRKWSEKAFNNFTKTKAVKYHGFLNHKAHVISKNTKRIVDELFASLDKLNKDQSLARNFQFMKQFSSLEASLYTSTSELQDSKLKLKIMAKYLAKYDAKFPNIVKRIKSSHVRTICLKNGKLLGLALYMYASDNKGKFPDNLKQLVEQEFLTKKSAYRCPLVKGDQFTDFIYLGKGKTKTDNGGKFPVLLAKSANHNGTFTFIVFSNGVVNPVNLISGKNVFKDKYAYLNQILKDNK